jgi:hypothetical protein
VYRSAINAFLLFHLAAILCWSIPAASPLLLAIRDEIRPYMLWTGLFQSWDTFAPAPKATNTRLEGVVIAKDGRLFRYRFPEMSRLTLSRRYFKERYRKFAEMLPVKSNSPAWPDVARRLACIYSDPANPPEVVMLIQYSIDILPTHAQSRPRAEIVFQTRLYSQRPSQ